MKITTAQEALAEIMAGVAYLKGPNEQRNEILRCYRAQAFSKGDPRAPENRVFAYITKMHSKLVSDAPVVEISHDGDDAHRKTAAMLTRAENTWIDQTRHQQMLERLVPYVLTGWGVTLTTLDKIAGFSDEEDDVTSPRGVILNPDDVCWDPYASSPQTKRWCAHKYARDYDEVVEEAREEGSGWNLDAIEACAVDVALDDLSRAKNLQGVDVPRRRELVMWDMWCEGEGSGTQYTLSVNATGEGEFLREARPFFGPRTGPYNIWGIYFAPGWSIPLSPLGAAWPVILQLNEVAEAINIAATRGKSILISGLSDKQTGDVHKARSGDTVHVPAYKDGQAEVFEFGFVRKELIDLRQLLSDQVDRLLGMSDADRGTVTGVATATENSIANVASDQITGFVARRYIECGEAFLYDVLWYLFHDETVALDLKLSKEEREEFGQDSGRYQGGPADGEKWAKDEKFEGYGLKIEQYSMQRMSESKRRARSGDLMTLLPQLPLLQQLAPFVDVGWLLDEIGKGIDVPDLGKMVSGQKAADMLKMQMQQEQEQPQVPSGPPEQAQGAPRESYEVAGSAA